MAIFTLQRARIPTGTLAEGPATDSYRAQRGVMLALLTIAVEARSEQQKIDVSQDCPRRYGRPTPELDGQIVELIIEAIAYLFTPDRPVRYR